MAQFEDQVPMNLQGLLTGKAPSMADAVRSRSTERFRVQGGAVYNNSNRTIQFRITSAHYADMTTCNLHYTLIKDSPLQILEDIAVLSSIESARITCAGKEIEKVNRCSALKPLIYASCSREYYDTTLSFAGAYKYTPSYMGVLVNNQTDRDLYLADSTEPGLNSAAGVTPATRMAVRYDSGQLPGTIITSDANNSNTALVSVLRGILEDPTRISFTMADASGTSTPLPYCGIGAENGFMRAPINRDLTAFAAYDMCAPTMSGSHMLGGCVLPNSIDVWNTQGSGVLNNKGGLAGTAARDYSMPLSLIFGLCRTHDVLVPVRNMGSIEVELVLAPYQEFFLHGAQKQGLNVGMDRATDVSSSLENVKVNSAGYDTYSITNPYLTLDIVQCNDRIVSRVDQMCSSSEGFSMSIESYTTLRTPIEYSEEVSINYLQAFSSLRDVYVSFRPARGQNVGFGKSDYYLGSRFLEADVQVGSTQFPTQAIQGPAQAYTELMKSFSHLDHRRGGGIIDYKTYIGERCCPNPFASASAGLMPSLVAANSSTKAYGQLQVNNMPSQKPSCFLLGQSFERILKESKTYSGISSRASGLGLTHHLRFRAFDSTKDPNSDPTSLMNPRYLDAALGSANDLLCDTVFHHDVLITIANDSVSVAT